jgi:hypothetical protein
VSELEAFPEGSRVDAAVLAKAGLIAHAGGPVKILGDGELKRKLTVAASKFSASAIQKIMGAGGTAVDPAGQTVLPPPPPAPKPKVEKADQKAEQPEKAPKAEKAQKKEKPPKAEKPQKAEKPKKADEADKSKEAPQ